ncbi:MAG: B12-binding domain-containing radical SAM protein [Candidatus Brocadiaceae bacterium]|nr:B12-binding domain-containing radical SAM protein [Candidatus Brocadiaceae bacterium]
MKLLLINPSKGKDYRAHSDFKIGAEIRDKKYFALPLALTTVASLTQPDVDINIIDEEIEPVNFDIEADIVALTAMTCKAKRAYQIADEFRQRGRYVIMGGIHASMMPDEALEHVDTVIVGEAEPIWKQVVDDYKNNKIQRLYRSEGFVDISETPLPRRDLIKNEAYSLHMMQTTRGCPFQCNFCSVQKFNGRKVRLAGLEKVRKDLENIIEINKSQIDASRSKLVDINGKKYDGVIQLFITDDNFTINKNHAIEVCNVLKEVADKHNIKFSWVTHADVSVVENDELLKLLSDAGCRRLFVGFESLEDANLNLIHKHCKKSEGYSEAIKKIYSYGIDIIASFVIGNDHDTTESLNRLVDFARENYLINILISILTPYPGTDLYFELEKENRILSKDWDCYDFGNVVYQPKELSVDELLQFQNELFTKFYDIKSMHSMLLARDKGLFVDKDMLFFEKPVNKYKFMPMINQKISKVLTDAGMPLQEIQQVISYAEDYAYNAGEGENLTFRIIGGVLNFVDKAHYVYWKKNYSILSQN